ncbi:MAG: hypothetical protein COC21_06210 [Verrucomicrobiales bacterium]|nr:MAG: hypothetical protein COC21_06210 [Verrucomicrobiales bacterium]
MIQNHSRPGPFAGPGLDRARFDLKRPERLRRRKRPRRGDKRGWENGGKYGKSYHDATWLGGV